MYVILLLFGVVAAVLGLAAVAMGISPADHTFDPNFVTPGTVAFVGGLVVVALGLAVRALQHIERALVARPTSQEATLQEAVSLAPGSHTAVAHEAAADVSADEHPSEPVRSLLPPKPKSELSPQLAVAAPSVALSSSSPTPADVIAFERLRERFSTLVRVDRTHEAEDADAPLLPKVVARSDEGAMDVHDTPVLGRPNGNTPVSVEPRPEVRVRHLTPRERQKNSIFESLWSTGRQARRGSQAAPVHQFEPRSAPQAELRPRSEAPHYVEAEPQTQAAAVQYEAPIPVSILKSGIVDGMAYTLYSDGSIEAQLPQGTLRFGSITELRNHIEQSA